MADSDERREDHERAIVGAILLDVQGGGERCVTVAIDKGVKSSWFEDDDLAALYEAGVRAFSEGKLSGLDARGLADEALKVGGEESWERATVRLEGRGRNGWLIELMDSAVTPVQLERHIHALRGHVYQKSFAKAFTANMKSFLFDPVAAITALIDKASETYTALVGDSAVNKGELCRELEEQEYQSWHMRVDPDGPRDMNWVPGLRTPWNALTKIYLGIGNRFHIIAARPSVGKTSIAVNFTRFWADEGKRVLFNSLDMPPIDVIDRLRTEKSRVSMTKKRYTPTQENLSRLKEASEWVKAAPIEVTENYYVEDFCVDIAMKARTGKIDVVIVDYVQLLNSYKVDNSNEYARVSYVAEYLKRTANRFKIPLIALCQLNRQSGKNENAEPTLTDLRGSGALEQAASSVMLLHRDYDVVAGWQKGDGPYWLYKNESYGRINAKSNIDPVWVIVAKNQNGPKGKLPFVVNQPYFTWKLADPMAKPYETEEGHGATKRVVRDNTPKFCRFHRDWRHDSWEQDMEGRTLPFSMDGSGVQNIIVEDEL